MKNKKEIKKRGSWASYRDEKDGTLFRCDTDELAIKLLNWGEIPKTLGNTKAFEISILAESYLRLRNKWPVKDLK